MCRKLLREYGTRVTLSAQTRPTNFQLEPLERFEPAGFIKRLELSQAVERFERFEHSYQLSEIEGLPTSAFLPPTEDIIEQFGVALEIVQDFRWSEGRLDVFDEPGLFRRRIDPVWNAIQAPNHFLAALGKHKVDEQARRVGMGCLRGDTGGMNIGKGRI